MNIYAEQGGRSLERALADDRQQFGSFFLARFFGFEISYPEDKCVVAFEALPIFFNPQGSLHGGVLSMALDISMGHLLHHTAGAGATLEMKVQFLKPVTAGIVKCEASYLRRGAKLSFLQSHARDSDGDLVAAATATWKLLSQARD